MFYQDKPIDWLLDHFLYVKVCNPEKDAVSLVSSSVLFYFFDNSISFKTELSL